MKTWNTIDKSDWIRGEWDNEPDKAQWIDEKTGLDCLMVRGPSGALCGYVGVPESNQWFDVDYGLVEAPDSEWLDVHGGLTFGDRCNPSTDESRHVCHSGDIANKTVFWLGFDCAHSDDICPQYHKEDETLFDRTYKTLAYVKNQVELLASQVV